MRDLRAYERRHGNFSVDAVANESGEYVVPNVPPGVYGVRVSLG